MVYSHLAFHINTHLLLIDIYNLILDDHIIDNYDYP